MTGEYRPAGPLNWIIDHLPNHSDWDLIGAISAEPRANEVVRLLFNRGKLHNSCFIDIEDQASEFQIATQDARKLHRNELQNLFGQSPNAIPMELFSEIDDLDDMFAKIDSNIGDRVMLDITSLPKRFFFYLVRKLRAAETVKNLIVTYTVPRSYGKTLHKNPGGWMPLPGV